jgi:segregation and condensation protein B
VTEADLPLAELEALIFAAPEPCSPAALRRALPQLSPGQIAEAVERINAQLLESGRPYAIARIDGSYQFRTRPEFGALISAMQPERKLRLSRAALETLAVVAYRQPITRVEIEEVRSVDCGPVLRSLLERDLLRIVGRRDAPGRPALYGTTSSFLQAFGLNSLRDMPPLRELELPEESGSETESESDASAAADAQEAEEAGDARIEPGTSVPAS